MRKIRIAHQMCLWALQEQRKIWFIKYWKTIFTSPFLEDVEAAQQFIINSKKQ